METKLLVCAATWSELRTYEGRLDATIEQHGFGRQDGDAYLVTGVGIPRALEQVLQFAGHERPRQILNLGIAGAYPGTGLEIGELVMGESEVYGDVGFQLPEAPGFQPLREAFFGQDYREPLPLFQFPRYAGLVTARGCTVNTCTGTEETGRLRTHLFQASFETMEGAAVAQAGQALGIPVCEIRAISNMAARRDMQPANIRLALSRLSDFFSRHREAHRA